VEGRWVRALACRASMRLEGGPSHGVAAAGTENEGPVQHCALADGSCAGEGGRVSRRRIYDGVQLCWNSWVACSTSEGSRNRSRQIPASTLAPLIMAE
jgi:hypothetical protein